MNKPRIKRYYNLVHKVWMWSYTPGDSVKHNVKAVAFVIESNKPIWDKINAS